MIYEQEAHELNTEHLRAYFKEIYAREWSTDIVDTNRIKLQAVWGEYNKRILHLHKCMLVLASQSRSDVMSLIEAVSIFGQKTNGTDETICALSTLHGALLAKPLMEPSNQHIRDMYIKVSTGLIERVEFALVKVNEAIAETESHWPDSLKKIVAGD